MLTSYPEWATMSFSRFSYISTQSIPLGDMGYVIDGYHQFCFSCPALDPSQLALAFSLPITTGKTYVITLDGYSYANGVFNCYNLVRMCDNDAKTIANHGSSIKDGEAMTTYSDIVVSGDRFDVICNGSLQGGKTICKVELFCSTI